MAQKEIEQSGSGAANMKCRMTYTAGNGSITITGFEGCRTDGYTTQDTQSNVTKTVYVNIAGNSHSFTTTAIRFPSNSNWASWSMGDAITQNNLNGTVNVTITFSGSTNSNINDSVFSTNINVGYTIVKPTLSNLNVQNITDTSLYASFDVTNTGNQTPYDPYIQLSTTNNFSNVIKTIYSRGGTFSGLDPNRTYYVRGSDANDAGRVYTNTLSVTTSFTNPGAPGRPYLRYNQSEPIPSAVLRAVWTTASAGSTPVAGYRIRLFKNNIEVSSVDTNNISTVYTFGSFEDLGFQPGDVAKVGIYSYSLDWSGEQHFNGGGSADSQVYSSNTVTVVSDKYVYVSQNGGNFNKYEIYISINGGNFIEVTKDKLKIIGE